MSHAGASVARESSAGRPSISRGPLWLVAIIATLLGSVGSIGLMDGVAEHGDLTAYDPDVTEAVVAVRDTPMTLLAQTLTFLGSALALVTLTLLVLGYLVWRRYWPAAVVLASGMALSLAVTVIVKQFFGRARPGDDLVLGPIDLGYAFPSGHTLNGTVCYGLLAGLLLLQVRSTRGRMAVIVGWLLLAVGIGLSRIYLAYHWLTDVLAGWSLALVVLGLVAVGSLLYRRGRLKHVYDRQVDPTPRPGSEHVLTFPERQVAEQVAADLREEGFTYVQVARASDGSVWGVHLIDDRLPDVAGGGAYEGLRDRFAALVEEHGGSYDAPGDPRPPVDAQDA